MSYYAFCLHPGEHSEIDLFIVRRRFANVRNPARVIYAGTETMESIRNMIYALCIRGEPIVIQDGNLVIENVLTHFPTLLDDR